jgi:hypothetical protein
MNLPASLAVLALSLALLFFGRGRDGDALPIFQKFPWIVMTLFSVAVLYLFFAGLMGVAVNMGCAESASRFASRNSLERYQDLALDFAQRYFTPEKSESASGNPRGRRCWGTRPKREGRRSGLRIC